MDSLCVSEAMKLPYHLQISALRKAATPQARQSHAVSSMPKGEPGLCWAVQSLDPGLPGISPVWLTLAVPPGISGKRIRQTAHGAKKNVFWLLPCRGTPPILIGAIGVARVVLFGVVLDFLVWAIAVWCSLSFARLCLMPCNAWSRKKSFLECDLLEKQI